jgi:V-type H+-transporting ATPase subunit D
VSGKKHRDAAAEDKLRSDAKEAAEEKEAEAEKAAETKDLLGDEDNQDVIF